MDYSKVILVDTRDRVTGTMEKMEAHEKAVLHRAFSVFLFNLKGEMLLQQRALTKYHSGGLWTNACCSHPAPGEETATAARRRLGEELGLDLEVNKVFDFVYRAEFDNGLTEHEFDHVFTGSWEGPIQFNPDEVMAIRYLSMESLRESMEKEPEIYTAWFRIAFPRIEEWYKMHFNSKAD